ncbi:hypothetical protein NB231_07130 [Nitrococcus mobilis Nb-231]|uniref:Uncharacterized protein n=1 Tax=Nitrococcus mobilis Nb-231 TaxID=314278 RepID=A4BUZ2_9GAMM|nr:hypothetical protein NB231_07130 [Nitrococcus mobilis Nb-231]
MDLLGLHHVIKYNGDITVGQMMVRALFIYQYY